MGRIAKTEARDGILWVYVPHVIDPNSMPGDRETYENLHAECSARGCSAIIFDARDADVRLDWPDKLRGIFALAKAQVQGRRVAILADQDKITPNGALGNVAGLAGAMVCVFSDEQKALAWIRRPTRRAEAVAAGDSEGREQ